MHHRPGLLLCDMNSHLLGLNLFWIIFSILPVWHTEKNTFTFFFFFLNDLYTQQGAGTHDPKIRRQMLF